MKKNIAVAVGVGILFAGIGLYFGLQAPIGTSPASTSTSAVTSLFAQSMPAPDGSVQSLAKWKGQPVVVNFWATWCGPCVEEMPELSALQTELAPKKVQIIGIGIDSPGNIKDFAEKYKITYPLYVAGMTGTELTRQFGNAAGGLPYTVLINADGKVAKTYLGRLKMDELRRDVSALAAGA